MVDSHLFLVFILGQCLLACLLTFDHHVHNIDKQHISRPINIKHKMLMKRTLLFIAPLLGAWAAKADEEQTTTTCSVGEGFIGFDSGEVTFEAFEYYLYVTAGTNVAEISDNLVPELEIYMAEVFAGHLIDDCSEKDLTGDLATHIVGFHTNPADKILSEETCPGTITLAAAEGLETDCYVIHSDWTIYVNSTSQTVSATFGFATQVMLYGFSDNKFGDIAQDYPSFIGIHDTFNEATSLTSSETPTATPVIIVNTNSNSTTSDSSGGGIFDFSSHIDTINEFRTENSIIFFAIVAGGFVSIFCCCYVCCRVCCGRGEKDIFADSDSDDDSDDDDDDSDSDSD